MRITVRFFATLRDQAGTERVDVELPNSATVATLLDQIAGNFPGLKSTLPSSLVAINHEYAFPDDLLKSGDEIAIFPPVSGGTDGLSLDLGWPEYFSITTTPLNIDATIAIITHPETGAVCAFSGIVRGITTVEAEYPSKASHLEYEAYQPMAEKKLRQIAQEIRNQFPQIQGIAIVQRIGKMAVGETTLLVACASGHRDGGCFEAARYGIDRLKEIVPIWKREFRIEGSSWIEGHYHPTPTDVQDSEPLSAMPQQELPAGKESLFSLECLKCQKRHAYTPERYLCACGGTFQLINVPSFDRTAIDTGTFSLWRYRAMLLPPEISPLTLGEGWTPLISIQIEQRRAWLKLENLNPTGSFKDRGAALLVTMLRTQGIEAIHDDSSGNAGAALAAYAAHAGIPARLFVPISSSPAKLAQIKLYGAQLEEITGPRSAASEAAQKAAQDGTSTYASHVYNPFPILAYKSIAYELWEQLGFRAPDVVILPIGQGTQLLGLAQGFNALLEAGMINRLPRLIGIQAATCAPLWKRYHRDSSQKAREEDTLAEGIRIIDPVRWESVLASVKASRGDIVVVSESAIIDGLKQLARQGIFVEPTSAVVWPAFKQIAAQLPEDTQVVLSITGTGYKTSDWTKLPTK